MTTDNTENSKPVISPVTQFVLLIVPVVMNGFFIVYALAGWTLVGRDRFNWSLEAESVAAWVGMLIIVYCALVLLYIRIKKARWLHPLGVSSFGHILVAIILTALVFITLRL
ncbi:MAG: hypothetical protein KTR35_13425 [Gammaproteobacteria bacterium]|nr:hypothetical protein [Gammaproteobacteria bacterium]